VFSQKIILDVTDFEPSATTISLMEQLGFEHQPHDTRHTCISLLAEAHVDQTMIKKIVGHKGAMSLTERVYTHPDIKALVDAINMI
jgi:integrase